MNRAVVGIAGVAIGFCLGLMASILDSGRCPKNEAIWILVERQSNGFIAFKKTTGPPDEYSKDLTNYWIAHPYER